MCPCPAPEMPPFSSTLRITTRASAFRDKLTFICTELINYYTKYAANILGNQDANLTLFAE
ncbi:hypothetical protein EJB05_23733, partial [Eragrostis curvula]